MIFEIGDKLVEVPVDSIRELIDWCREEGSEEALAIAAVLEEHVPGEES